MSESTFSLPSSSSPSSSTINRKRTASTSEKKHPSIGRRTPSGSSHNKESSGEKNHSTHGGPWEVRKGKKENGYGNGWNHANNAVDKAPSLNVDIRNSLMLPSLSQRFSVLLPSLSTAPEESLRSLLASQRARPNGPALTEEEEELLFAEMRDVAQEDQWDGRPPQMNENWIRNQSGTFGKGGGGGGISNSFSSPSLLTTSSSNPSLSTNSDDGRPQSNIPSTPGSFLSSPPPTSNSFSSFQTFGVGSSPDINNNPSSTSSSAQAFKTKSYGFSGGSGMREAEYIRKIKKSISHKDLKNGQNSMHSQNNGEDDNNGNGNGSTPTRHNIPVPPAISPEKANAYYKFTKRPESPTASEKTATPTSSIIPNISTSSLSKIAKGHSRSSSTPPTPTSASSQLSFGKQQKARKRQSRLDGLSPAQVKRISLALQEIGGQLKRGSMAVSPLSGQPKNQPLSTSEDIEEMLDESRRTSQFDQNDEKDRVRRPSDISSTKGSCQSATSSVFPFQMSPTNSTFTGINTEPSSPSKLPPSPRTHNLLAHVEEPLPPIPMPVFTPTRSQPVRHQPTSSSSSTSTIAPNQPVYIPGQPRPIRLTHHSQSSVSSRSATPSNQSPLDAIRTAYSPDNTPSPIQNMPDIASRTSSLGRSRSVNQVQNAPTKSSLSEYHDTSHHSPAGVRRRGTMGDSPVNRRLSSSLSSNPSTPDIIEETDEPTSDSENQSPDNQSTEDMFPEVKNVIGRHNVANSRTTSSNSIHQLHHNLGWGLASGEEPFERSVSAQGTIDESDNTPPNESDSVQPQSPTTTLKRQTSTNSINSSFSESGQLPEEIIWANVFGGNSVESYEVNLDGMISPEPEKEAETLRKMSGMGLEEMMLLQEKLVVKAKAEREALRGDMTDEPAGLYSPPLTAEAFSLTERAMSPVLRATSPPLERPISPPPPSSWRFPSADPAQSSSQNTTPSQDRTTLPSSVDTHILTPPLTGSSSASVSRSGSKSNQMMLPTRPPPPPPQQPAETPSEIADEIQTPPSVDISRKSSGRAHHRLPLEQDPEVRRDFEARIAAATAALNRTPSLSQAMPGKLDRKFSKKGGPMVISSPKLVSSTANVPTTPLTPENQIQIDSNSGSSSGQGKNSEKSSGVGSGSLGSGSKMSFKWKKFTGLRNKGPSFSGNEVTPYPPAQSQQQQHKLSPSKQLQQQQQQQLLLQQQQQSKLSPIQNINISQQGNLQRSASASVAQRLEDPINLKANEHPEAPPSAPPNLDAFRFPTPPDRYGPPQPPPPPAASQQDVPSPPSSLGHSSGLRNVMNKMKRSKDTSPPPQQKQGRAQSPIPAQNKAMSPLPAIDSITKQPPRHTPTSSDDDARNRFIEAGRALGLTEDQLNDMLTAKGMAGTSTSAPLPVLPPAPVSSLPSPPPTAPVTGEEKVPKQDKEKKGLFRSLSKARKAQTSPIPTSELGPSAPIPEPIPKPLKQDRVVVRRTMILPEGLNIIPSTPLITSGTPQIPQSPDSTSLQPGFGGILNQQRKQSIRRKPLQLSKEDEELVSNSPPAHRRNFSFSNQSGSGKSLSDSGGNNTPTKLIFGDSSSNNSSSNQLPSQNMEPLHGLGFLHPNTPILRQKASTTSNLNASPGNDSLIGGGDDESHTRSSTGGSLIDMYRNSDFDDEEEEMLESPQKKLIASSSPFIRNDVNDEDDNSHTRRGSEDGLARGSMEGMNRRRMTQAVEITEYADGQVIWNIVDALRTSVTGSVDGEEYTFNAPGEPHSRSTSYSSSVRNSIIPEDKDVFQAAGNNAGWPKALGNGAGTAGLNLRHRDRNVAKKPRPPTDIYFTSHADVADLIDHLSRDLDASHGRIDIISHLNPTDESQWPPSNASPFVYQDSATTTMPTTPERQTRRASTTRSLNSQFEDAPSPAQLLVRPSLPSPINPSKANRGMYSNNNIENLSPGPQKHLFAENYQDAKYSPGGVRGQSYFSTNSGIGMSPSSKSFASSVSGQGRSVEDRLQALLDRLKGDGAGKTQL